MEAIEWWPTSPGKDGKPTPRVFATGPCGECGANVTISAIPHLRNYTLACSPSCRRRVTERGRRDGTLPLEGRPKPWSQPEEFDAWIEGGQEALDAHRRAVSVSKNTLPAKRRKPASKEAGMLEQARVIGRAIAKRRGTSHEDEIPRLLATLPESYQHIALGVADEHPKKDPAAQGKSKLDPERFDTLGMDEKVYVVATNLSKLWQKGDEAGALAVLNMLPGSYHDKAIQFAKWILKRNARENPKKPTPQPEPSPVVEAPVAYTEQQIASYQVYRVTVSKSRTPIVDEYRRRLMCPRPDKVAYDDTELGWAAAKWHADDLRNGEYADLVDAYKCACGYLHIGRDWSALHGAARRKVS